MRRGGSERGSALVVALMMLLALGFIGAALVITTSADLKVAGEGRRGTRAQFVAEAGIQEALHRLALPAGTNVTVGSETFDASIRDTSVPLDPDWEVRIYTPDGTTPTSADASIVYTPTVQSAAGGLDYADTGGVMTVRHKWVDLNADGVRDAGEMVRYDSGLVPPENFTSGSPVEVIEVAGQYADARRRLRVEATRFPFSPNVIGAISSDRGVDVTGNTKICGHNHRVDTPAGSHLESGPPCSATYDEASGHLPAIVTTGDDIDAGGSSSLLGSPTATDSSSTNPFYSLAQALGVTQDVVDRILADPDHTSTSGTMDGITYVQGDASFNGGDHTGLLYVTGDLQISGNTTFRGLIYVEGDLRITGTPWILGGIMVRGRSESAFSAGNSGVLYSRDMIRIALESAFDYVVLSWKEL
jgi:hypothetical protein